MSKIDLFRKEWLDVVFENKNKAYGAYQLRQKNSSTTTRALLFASAAFILLFITPKIISMIKGALPEEEVAKQVEVAIQPPPPDKYYQLHTAEITSVNLDARQLHIDFWIIGGKQIDHGKPFAES